MDSRREGNPRLRYLTLVLVLFALVALGVPNQLVTQWTYAVERGRFQADTEELAEVSRDLAQIQEVSHAFRLVARVAQPGVVHIRVAGGAEARVRLAELERLQEKIRRRLSEIERVLETKPDDAPPLDEILELYDQRRSIERQQEEELERRLRSYGSPDR